ncbi:MAG: ChaN family lipoprotein [Rhodobacteraceae bacterium]|nr:ChaN family lipoprotein [Paracoccaceae bacterium]
MNRLRFIACWASCVLGTGVAAGQIDVAGLAALPRADIVLLGEVHDNAAHHLNQAAVLRALRPAAVVFEMLTDAQARIANSSGLAGADLAAALDWSTSGWPAFDLYAPVFAALGDARVYGMAVSRDDVRAVFDQGPAAVFGADAGQYGLDAPLPADQQAARQDLQREAHCDALPADLLPGMVAAQRLRDAAFARTALRALAETGGPVAVITGIGHARRDWGMPLYLARAAPDVTVLSLGQIERGGGDADDAPPYDLWLLTGAAERDDPCASFAD